MLQVDSSFEVKRGRPPSDEQTLPVPISLLLAGHPVRKNPACLGDILFSKVQCHGTSVCFFFWEVTCVFCYKVE